MTTKVSSFHSLSGCFPLGDPAISGFQKLDGRTDKQNFRRCQRLRHSSHTEAVPAKPPPHPGFYLVHATALDRMGLILRCKTMYCGADDGGIIIILDRTHVLFFCQVPKLSNSYALSACGYR